MMLVGPFGGVGDLIGVARRAQYLGQLGIGIERHPGNQPIRLPWDPNVQALLPFPSILDTMASDMGWTTQLGNAVLAQRQDVMDAVQRMRQKARDFGYLRTNPQAIVSGGPYIAIMLVARPAFYVVPYYDPGVVFLAPRPGFAVGAAINFGFGISIGAAFRPWGWGAVRMGWDTHGWFIGDRPWGRTWATRATYVHPYTLPHYEGAAVWNRTN